MRHDLYSTKKTYMPPWLFLSGLSPVSLRGHVLGPPEPFTLITVLGLIEKKNSCFVLGQKIYFPRMAVKQQYVYNICDWNIYFSRLRLIILFCQKKKKKDSKQIHKFLNCKCIFSDSKKAQTLKTSATKQTATIFIPLWKCLSTPGLWTADGKTNTYIVDAFDLHSPSGKATVLCNHVRRLAPSFRSMLSLVKCNNNKV